MSHRRKLSRLVLATLAATSIAAPTASAGPIDPVGTGFHDQQTTRDARGESAAGGGPAAGGPVREPRAQAAPTWPVHPTPLAGGGAAAAAAGPVREPRVQAAPTWPAYPTPLPRPAQSPLVADGGDDVDLPVVLLVIAGALALGGGLAVASLKVRAHTREAH